jgi:hypothetical protein
MTGFAENREIVHLGACGLFGVPLIRRRWRLEPLVGESSGVEKLGLAWNGAVARVESA